MISATLDLAFQLPTAKPLEKPMAFTGAQFQRLLAWSKSQPVQHSAALSAITDRARSLRGSSISWAFGLRLADLTTWSVRNARGSAPHLTAPVTFFKTEYCQWVPKVVIWSLPADQIETAEFTAFHTTCRRASIELMTITDEHIADGYLESKHFKRAFNGAFFCDRLTNTTIFCPTLRDWGFRTWNESAPMSVWAAE